MAEKGGSKVKVGGLRSRSVRSVDMMFDKFRAEVEKLGHWPNVTMPECRKIYLAGHGSEFREGVPAHDRIKKILEKARTKWRKSHGITEQAHMATVKRVRFLGRGKAYEAL